MHRHSQTLAAQTCEEEAAWGMCGPHMFEKTQNGEQRTETPATLAKFAVWSCVPALVCLSMCNHGPNTTQVGLCSDMLQQKCKLDTATATIVNTFCSQEALPHWLTYCIFAKQHLEQDCYPTETGMLS